MTTRFFSWNQKGSIALPGGEVPEEAYTIDLGAARIVRSGTDVTLISYGAMVPVSLSAADEAQEELDVSMEVIDLRTLIPYDVETVLESVQKNGSRHRRS